MDVDRPGVNRRPHGKLSLELGEMEAEMNKQRRERLLSEHGKSYVADKGRK